MPLSSELINETIADNVYKAYHKIHELGVLHGDVRKENILVRKDESIVIVDFERTEINNVPKVVIDIEDCEVQALLLNLQE